MLRQLLDRRHRYLNPVLLVLLAAHLGVATIIGVMVQSAWGPLAVGGAFVVELVVLYLVAEAIPKSRALADVDGTATRLAPLVWALGEIPPLRWIANAPVPGRVRPEEVSSEDLVAWAGAAEASDAIEPPERKMIEAAVTFGATVAREVMVPRPDMVMVGEDFRIVDAVEVVILNGFSRVPAYGASVDDIVGIVHAKDLTRSEHDGHGEDLVSTIMRRPRFVPETKRIATLMREMQAEKFHMAVVVDEHGGTSGLVTLEDLIEELVGEIVDEFDVEEPMIEEVDGGVFRVNGRVPLDGLTASTGVRLPEGEWDTVGGLIFTQLGHVPSAGEAVQANGHELLVERVEGRRIARVLISPRD